MAKRTVSVDNHRTVIERENLETDPYISGWTSGYLTWAGAMQNALWLGPNLSVQGKMMHVKELRIQANRRCNILLLLGAVQGNSDLVAPYAEITVGPGEPYNVVLNQSQRPDVSKIEFRLINVEDNDPNLTVAQATNNLTCTKGAVSNSGSNYTYTINVNNATGSLQTTTVTEILPKGSKFISGSGTNWTVTESNGIITAVNNTGIATGTTSTITVVLRSVVTVRILGTAVGYIAEHDVNYSAQHVLGVCGTSISRLDNGITGYITLFRNWLRDTKGYNIRKLNKAVSGSTTRYHETARSFYNRYDFEVPPSFFLYEHGVNNISQSVPTLTTLADVSAMIRHKQKRWPNCIFIVLAPIPTQNTALESGLATLRPALKSTVEGFGDSNVLYCPDTGDYTKTWNPVTESGTYTTDGVHPNAAGYTKIFTALRDWCALNNIVKDAV